MMMCPDCLAALRDRDPRELARRAEEEERERARAVMLTTAHHLEGFRVGRTIDVVTAECVFGMNLLRDFFAGVTDIFGGRSQATQKVLREARETCLVELRREAARIGGNAVIGVSLDYSEFSGQGKSMLFLVASGTAVEVAPATPTG